MRTLREIAEKGVVAGAFFALPLALFALGVMVAVTALQAGLWTNMHALEQAGLVLTGRSLNISSGATLSYVAVAQVREGSAAAELGLARGEALVEIAGTPVDRPLAVWSALSAWPGRLVLSLCWIPRVESALGTVQLRTEAEQARVVLVEPGEQARAAGLAPGDVLLAVNGTPVSGTRQVWEALVVAVRQGLVPVELLIRRGADILRLPFDPRRFGELRVERDPWRAWKAFLTRIGDPRYPEQAGLLPALLGSLGVVLVMAVVAFPLGIGAAVYLEEYARPGRLTAALELLVASLAGLPSAVIGLLGLEIFARALH
ncbi:MAG: hypothetical protein ACK42E_04885, partial [Candidatus Bipolaricaulaceae bacterium]